ncbi:MAG: hypothetical protein K5917_06935 [Clostridiales bacterium]|nr:hypothetical protein [Clostridiales bacterium]
MKITLKELVVFALFGGLMYASKILLEFLPNVHLLAMFIVTLTVIYRKKALYPIYTFIFITGILNGFSLWWIPYLYIWAVLWGVTMLLPKNMPSKVQIFVYPIVASLHGFLYGTLYAPAQAIMFGLDFKGMIAWIVAGLPWDCVHGISNFFSGFLIVPFIAIIRKAQKTTKLS